MKYNSELATNMHDNCRYTTSAKNTALYEKMRAGDLSAREKLIVNNMPLVAAVVNDFIDSYPNQSYLQDDLTSEGFVALTKAVNNLERYHTPVLHMTAYFVSVVRHAIYKFIDINDGGLTDDIEVPDMYEMVDTQDMLDASCLTNLDKTVLTLRQHGHTFREITARTGLHPEEVRRLLVGISERFEQRKKNLQ
jgi:RNA polymerase sigma factor (sigma-70 family)